MSTILVTGGTGSLGSRLVRELVHNTFGDNSVSNIVVFSRDEQKQFKMKIEHRDISNIHYVLGDVRDFDTVMEAMDKYDPDIVIHTAAQKHIKECDSNPMQAVMTNINGTQNVAKACTAHNVKKACLISTDKAVDPTTLYGMTKYVAERIWINAGQWQTKTKFVGVRYGNVINSAGSLIPFYLDLAKKENPVFPLTDLKMTRFFITFAEAVYVVLRSLFSSVPSSGTCKEIEICNTIHNTFLVPQLISANIGDIANIFADVSKGTVVENVRVEGEKTHEILYPGYSSEHGVIHKSALYVWLEKEGLLP